MKKLLITMCVIGVLGSGIRLRSQTAPATTANSAALKVRKVEAQVEVAMNPGESQSDLRNRAVDQARREIVEKANGTSVRSITALNNAQVLLDLIHASSEGLVLNPEFLENGPGIQGQAFIWKVRLRADVTEPRTIQQDPDFKIQINLDSELLRPDDRLHLTVRTTKDAYVHIFNVFADGSVTVLLPNRFHTDKHLAANTDLRFPSQAEERQGLSLVASLPKDQLDTAESIVVVATKRDVDLVQSDFKEAVLKEFEPGSTGLLSQLALKLFNLGDSEWVQNVATYRIVRDPAQKKSR